MKTFPIKAFSKYLCWGLCIISLGFIYNTSINGLYSDSYDLIRHRSIFSDVISDSDAFAAYYFSDATLDSLFYRLVYFGANEGLVAESFFGILSCIIFTVLFITLKKNSPTNNLLYVVLLSMFAFINFSLISGIRFYLGLSFFGVSLLFFSKHNWIKSAFVFLLAVTSHFSFIVYAPIYLFGANVRLSRNVYIIVAFFIFFASLGFYLPYIINMADALELGYAPKHVIAYFNLESGYNRVWYYYLLKYMPIVPGLFLIIYSKASDWLIYALFYTLLVVFFALPNFVFFDRAFMVYVYMLCFLSVTFKAPRAAQVFTLISIFCSFIAEIYSNIDVFF